MKRDALHLFSLPHLGNMARENYKQRRWCGGTGTVGELPLGARDPLEGGVPRLAVDGTVSGRGGCGLAVGGSGMVA